MSLEERLKERDKCILKNIVEDKTTSTKEHINGDPNHPMGMCRQCNGYNKRCEWYRPMKNYEDVKLNYT